MIDTNPHRLHLASSDDFITSEIGFHGLAASFALQKKRREVNFAHQALALKVAASAASSPADLINIKGIQSALLTAAGVSDKAAKYLQPEDKTTAILGLVENFLAPAGADFAEELVFRFLLTRGDTLGGSMRNVGGVLAQRKLSRALISTLALDGIPYLWLHSTSNAWALKPEDDSDVELHLRGLSWSAGEKRRTVIFNLTVPFLKNNVDLCLFNCDPEGLQACVGSPASYVALGELKGGIDPAGADEHWKTARSALERIRKAFEFSGMKPHTFFIGAAIAQKMAEEIWADLEAGQLRNAANLTVETQVAFVSRWLCSL